MRLPPRRDRVVRGGPDQQVGLGLGPASMHHRPFGISIGLGGRAGQHEVAGEVDGLLASHRMLTGPAAEADRYADRPVVHLRRAAAQAHLLVRATADDPVPPGWEAHPVGLEELALAYLREPGAAALPGPARSRDTQPSEVTQ